MLGEPMAFDAGVRKREALELFAPLPRHYDRVAAALSFGQDPRWRRAMVETVGARSDETVLDVATGTGMVARSLVRRYGCEVVGVDQSEQMLDGARRKLAADRELATRVTLLHGEAERLPFEDARFDHLTFTYLLRYVEDRLARVRGALRQGVAGGVALLHTRRPAHAWPASLVRVGLHGALSRQQHPRFL
jgi:demethylmenaquinone methyltransferase/2-methoxy-6-polyprenyl-1,4-benzoquinol methylase